ncbi:MAG: hypothetical protein SRB1_01034 [Desulfobacteraceae bacterium Eth-SRB1]|nr:MAG: hypothetical protein SRB1_01034 [Desulfobacteraceae bacterium Eth-SRB1]
MNNITKIIKLFVTIVRLLRLNKPGRIVTSVKALSRYLSDYREMERQITASNLHFEITSFYPCLNEWSEQSGIANGHYFHQDLLIAGKIHSGNPSKHVDIGSRIDGFVAHVASFREIEVFDIRKLSSTHPNIIFKQFDMMNDNFGLRDYCDSISSLHVMEHLGLGRYGDTVDSQGHLKGLQHILMMLKRGGKFYFSVPIGEQRIEFNAHRVFSLRYLFELLTRDYQIDSFSYVDDKGDLHRDVVTRDRDSDIENNFLCHYGCGIFELTKT